MLPKATQKKLHTTKKQRNAEVSAEVGTFPHFYVHFIQKVTAIFERCLCHVLNASELHSRNVGMSTALAPLTNATQYCSGRNKSLWRYDRANLYTFASAQCANRPGVVLMVEAAVTCTFLGERLRIARNHENVHKGCLLHSRSNDQTTNGRLTKSVLTL